MIARPPRLASWLLELLLAVPDRDYILGDLEEAYGRRAPQSPWRAGAWYWSQVPRNLRASVPGTSLTPLPQLILASASPRRSRLLAGLGIDLTVRPVDIDETPSPGEEPATYAQRLARQKAEEETRRGELVLA